MEGSNKTVLIADDDQDLLETFLPWLDDKYDTRLANDGQEAIDALGEHLDAVILDRRMPDMSGDKVLDEIRDRGYDCVVIMLTALDPDLDIIRMDFDDYLVKPVSPMTLLETLDYHLARKVDNSLLQEYLAILSKIDLLEREHTMMELTESDEYTRLKVSESNLREVLEDSIDDLDDISSTYLDIERN